MKKDNNSNKPDYGNLDHVKVYAKLVFQAGFIKGSLARTTKREDLTELLNETIELKKQVELIPKNITPPDKVKDYMKIINNCIDYCGVMIKKTDLSSL